MSNKVPKREFDFTQYKQRHIALKILYFGWDYDGLSTQLDNENTIEYHLFQALIKTCLVESRDKCNYNRCGRTDKGVSAHGQVVNLNVRSNLIDETDPQNLGLFSPESYRPSDSDKTKAAPRQEINYVETLNRVLTDHIKVIAWAPVAMDFSSRFKCCSRSYSYIFPIGDLCISSIDSALRYLIGEHDFRNLCSFDLKNGVLSHRRTITFASVEPIQEVDKATADNEQYSFYQVTIVGRSFLYHQIRCIMSILFLVGSKKEAPEVVRDLLDITKCTARPNYNRADPLPLCLFDCLYEPSDIPLGWRSESKSLGNLLKQLRGLWWSYKTKALMIERAILQMESLCGEGVEKLDAYQDEPCRASWKDFGLKCDTMSDAKYISLLNRPKDQTLEEKIDAMQRKAA